MTSAYDVFISYSRIDIDFAVDLERALSDLSVYRDQSTNRVGDAWFAAIINAIYSSKSVVVLLSPDYISSRFCMAELFHATGRDPDGQAKLVLPVLVRPVQLPDILRLIQYFDATLGQSREEVLQNIRSAIVDRPSGGTRDILPSIENTRLDLAAELNRDTQTQTLVRILRMAKRALANLEIRAAGYTSTTLPPTLEIELEDKRREVKDLEEQLRRAIRG